MHTCDRAPKVMVVTYYYVSAGIQKLFNPYVSRFMIFVCGRGGPAVNRPPAFTSENRIPRKKSAEILSYFCRFALQLYGDNAMCDFCRQVELHMRYTMVLMDPARRTTTSTSK